jgi:anti-anti-sigma factor
MNTEVQVIKDEDYIIEYFSESETVKFKGILSLSGPIDYEPIAELLEDAVTHKPPKLILDLKELEFLNSAGISMLSKFIIKMRKEVNVQIIVMGSKDILWQGKSLKNLQRFLPRLILEIE